MPKAVRGKALEGLTTEAAGLRVVMTSRPEGFGDTLDTGQQLPYAEVVELRPVDPQSAVEYLFEGQVGSTRPAWQDVGDHLVMHQDGYWHGH